MSDRRVHLAESVASAFKWACLSELEAMKPGNVHIFSDGHGMVVADFVKSADAAAAAIARPELTVGERILLAVEKTWDAVDCNTNLGILLLCAPLAHAVLYGNGTSLRERLRDVLQGLTLDDAGAAFLAISKAAPAGLGDSVQHDVRSRATVTLLQAMVEAQARDRIAWQYAHDYTDILDFGLMRYRTLLARWKWEAWATTGTYLEFLAQYPDTHVIRKHGAAIAKTVQGEAAMHKVQMDVLENPKLYLHNLREFDVSLKARKLNPGTSADLTVATLFAYAVSKLVEES